MSRDGLRKCCCNFAVNIGMVMTLLWYILIFILLTSRKPTEKWMEAMLTFTHNEPSTEVYLIVGGLSVSVLLAYGGIVSRIGYLMIPLISIEVFSFGIRIMSVNFTHIKSNPNIVEECILLGIHGYVILIEGVYCRRLLKDRISDSRNLPKCTAMAPARRINHNDLDLHYAVTGSPSDVALTTFPAGQYTRQPPYASDFESPLPYGRWPISEYWAARVVPEHSVLTTENEDVSTMPPPSYDDLVRHS